MLLEIVNDFRNEPRACQRSRAPTVKTVITLSAIVTDSFHWTAFHRLFAQALFLRALRLLVNIGMPAVIVSFEIRRGSLTAEVAVDALIVDVKFPVHIFGVFVSDISH